MARASSIAGRSCELHHHYLGYPRVLDFLDISATIDFAFPLDSSASSNEGVIGSCPSSSESSSDSG
jgi:hypothetical protein